MMRYVGIGVRGTFCAETQPRGAAGGFVYDFYCRPHVEFLFGTVRVTE